MLVDYFSRTNHLLIFFSFQDRQLVGNKERALEDCTICNTHNSWNLASWKCERGDLRLFSLYKWWYSDGSFINYAGRHSKFFNIDEKKVQYLIRSRKTFSLHWPCWLGRLARASECPPLIKLTLSDKTKPYIVRIFYMDYCRTCNTTI